jgi:hypothetical protein
MSAFDPVVAKSLLGPVGCPISQNNGESHGVYPLIAHPGWLLKVFKPTLITDADATRIDQLVALPLSATASDRTLLRLHSSWPATRVTDGSHNTYGVVLPIAPSPYWAQLRLNATHNKYKPLEIDWLATAPVKCQRRSVPVPSFTDRLQICEDLVAVAELLERYNLVYGDWSYANAFWSGHRCSGYVIDLDGCAFMSRTSLGTPNWDDPLAPSKNTDTLSDRYGVALLLARCLTGERAIESALDTLQIITGRHRITPLYDLICSGIAASERCNRPSIATLLAALSTADSRAKAALIAAHQPSTGVINWTAISKPEQLSGSKTHGQRSHPLRSIDKKPLKPLIPAVGLRLYTPTGHHQALNQQERIIKAALIAIALMTTLLIFTAIAFG